MFVPVDRVSDGALTSYLIKGKYTAAAQLVKHTEVRERVCVLVVKRGEKTLTVNILWIHHKDHNLHNTSD